MHAGSLPIRLPAAPRSSAEHCAPGRCAAGLCAAHEAESEVEVGIAVALIGCLQATDYARSQRQPCKTKMA